MWRVLIKKGGERQRIHALTYVKEGKKKTVCICVEKLGSFPMERNPLHLRKEEAGKKERNTKSGKGDPDGCVEARHAKETTVVRKWGLCVCVCVWLGARGDRQGHDNKPASRSKFSRQSALALSNSN